MRLRGGVSHPGRNFFEIGRIDCGVCIFGMPTMTPYTVRIPRVTCRKFNGPGAHGLERGCEEDFG